MSWKFADFAAAIAFVNSVAEIAEAANHHPDILVHGWNKVRLTLSTHSEGGLTERRLQAGGQIDPSSDRGRGPSVRPSSLARFEGRQAMNDDEELPEVAWPRRPARALRVRGPHVGRGRAGTLGPA